MGLAWGSGWMDVWNDTWEAHNIERGRLTVVMMHTRG